jgi:hypothetical protein
LGRGVRVVVPLAFSVWHVQQRLPLLVLCAFRDVKFWISFSVDWLKRGSTHRKIHAFFRACVRGDLIDSIQNLKY